MAFEFHIRIPENSEHGQIIQAMAEQQHITPQQAAERLLKEGAKSHLEPTTKRNFIKEGRGMFKDPEDARILDEAVAIALEERRRPSVQSLG